MSRPRKPYMGKPEASSLSWPGLGSSVPSSGAQARRRAVRRWEVRTSCCRFQSPFPVFAPCLWSAAFRGPLKGQPYRQQGPSGGGVRSGRRPNGHVSATECREGGVCCGGSLLAEGLRVRTSARVPRAQHSETPAPMPGPGQPRLRAGPGLGCGTRAAPGGLGAISGPHTRDEPGTSGRPPPAPGVERGPGGWQGSGWVWSSSPEGGPPQRAAR